MDFSRGHLEWVHLQASFIENILGQYELEEGYNSDLSLLSGNLAKSAKSLFSNKPCLDGEYRDLLGKTKLLTGRVGARTWSFNSPVLFLHPISMI